MRERKNLNRLVVGLLDKSASPPTARQMFDEIRIEHHEILRTDGVMTFKSFVSVINSFKGVIAVGERTKFYKRNI